MKIKFGAIVTDGRNKIGGHVASKNKSGNYLRTKVTPVNPQTTFQSAVRGFFGGLAQSWRGLTADDRQSWIDGAPGFPYIDIFGDSKILSGFGLYMKLNSVLLNIGEAAISVCPASEAVEFLTSLGVTTGLGSAVIDFAPTHVPANHSLVVLASPPLSAGKKASSSDYRQIAVLPATTPTGESIFDAYNDRFGVNLNSGVNINVRAYLVNTNTGQVSSALSYKVI